MGSEVEAALEELHLIRDLSPPANSRSRRKEHGVYLRPRGDELVVTKQPTELGPLTSRRQASLAARALVLSTEEELERLLEGGPLPRLRDRLAHLAENLRYEEAARLRDRLEALERVIERLRRLERLRTLELCLIAPAIEPGWRKAFFLAGGTIRTVRSLPPGAGANLELEAGRALCRDVRERTEPLTPDEAEELLLLDGFIRRPPPELTVMPLTEARRA
jgi:excinuclease UvrABC nuclease subunit